MRSAGVVFVFLVFASLPNMTKIRQDYLGRHNYRDTTTVSISYFLFLLRICPSDISNSSKTVNGDKAENYSSRPHSQLLPAFPSRRVELSLLLFSTINTTLLSPSCLNLSIHAASWWAPPTPTCQARQTRASRLVIQASEVQQIRALRCALPAWEVQQTRASRFSQRPCSGITTFLNQESFLPFTKSGPRVTQISSSTISNPSGGIRS